ncbi:homeobox-leucine zipper protein REVOLUTA-like [Cucumis melo var. makuwa]|uniref:Homeobox-leucine zipper protein REVOLUTA-like n=1 Tax=Cucumis melo var. makuwa TaxID=1194695 RepID=A0A5A7SQM1_CUCMM|nr:homeobox-leucine zipper protein REVOLUTA-like [Cucumis melo var. makuwa]TYJ98735.1 homeobox-leucine zipper protein REVOLUTA-like [Cucumis melo var. makuwa]
MGSFGGLRASFNSLTAIVRDSSNWDGLLKWSPAHSDRTRSNLRTFIAHMSYIPYSKVHAELSKWLHNNVSAEVESVTIIYGVQMFNASRLMKCYFKRTSNSALIEFSTSSEDNHNEDAGDGGGISMFTLLTNPCFGFAYVPTGICMSTMGRHASFEQVVAWKVLAEMSPPCTVLPSLSIGHSCDSFVGICVLNLVLFYLIQ